jgi:hypothetical protein
MNEDLLNEASELAEDGDRAAARLLILELLHDSPNYAAAWEALIEVAETDAERRKAIYQFWALEPDNPEANQLLQKIKAGKLPPVDEQGGFPRAITRQKCRFPIYGSGCGSFSPCFCC